MDYNIRNENRTINHPKGLKKCTRCLVIKPRTDEFFVVNATKTKTRDRHKGYCKECDKDRRAIQKVELKKDLLHYFNRLITTLKHRAKKQNVPFNITGKELYDKYLSQNKTCYWTGKEFDLISSYPNKSRPHDNFISVDRLDPILGYVTNNCVLCLWKVNAMKNNLNKEQFINFCKIVTSRIAIFEETKKNNE